MADLGELIARVGLDTTGLGSGLAQAQSQMAQVGNVAAAEFGRVTSAADGMGRGVITSAQGFGVLATESRNVSSSVAASASEMSAATGRAGALGSGVGNSAVAMGRLASESGSTASALSGSSSAMGQLANTAGATSSELSAASGNMAGVANEAGALGANVGAASSGFIRLNDSVSVATSSVAGAGAQMSNTANVGQTMYVQVSQSGGAFSALAGAARVGKAEIATTGGEMGKAGSAALAMGQRVEGSGRSYTVLDQLIGAAMRGMEQWFVRLQGSASPLERAIGNLGSKVIDLAKNMDPLMAVAAGGAVAAVAALTVVVGAGVKNFVDLGGEVRNFQRFTQASAVEASKMVYALDRVGIGADVGSKAMGRLALSIEKQPQKFNELGIAIAHNADGTVNLVQTLYNVADAYTATDDPTRRALIAQTAFGTSWRSMVPLLSQGSEGIRRMGEEASRFGLVMDQKGVDAAKRFSMGVKDLHDAVKGLTIAIGSEAVPVFAQMAAGLATVITPVTHVVQATGGLRGIMLGLVNTISPVAGMLAILGQHSLESSDKTNQLSDSMANEAAKAGLTDTEITGLTDSTALAAIRQHELSIVTDQVTAKLNAVQGATDLASRAFDSIKASTMGTATATLDVADAFANLKDTLTGGKQATLDVADAQLTLQRALERQKTVYADAKSSALDKRDADLAVQHAQIGLQQAMDATNITMDLTTVKGRENMHAFADAAAAIYGHTQALIDAHAPAETIRAAWDADTLSLASQMMQAGFTAGQVQQLFLQYGLIPKTVETAILVSGLQEKLAALQVLATVMKDMSATDIKVVVQAIGAGDTQAALDAILDRLYHIATYGEGSFFPPGPGKAMGGLTAGPTLAGEAGTELVLPLTRPSRMRALLSQFGGTIATAAGISGAGGGGGQSSTTNYILSGNVIASDPAELERQLEARARVASMSGRI